MPKVKISKDCIDEALRALKDFSAEELKQYTHDVFEKARSYPNISNAAAFEKAMGEINDSRMRSYFESAMTAANNASKIEANTNKIRNGKADAQDIFVKLHRNQADNVVSAQSAAREELEAPVFNAISREETEYLASGNNDLEIAAAYDGRKVGNKFANSIADLWKKVYFPLRNSNLITSNAMPFEHINEDRSFRNIHDPNKMMLGGSSAAEEAQSPRKYSTGNAKERWISWVRKHFDLVHSDAVDLDGKVDEAREHEIIGDMYENITTGKSDILTRSLVVNDRVAIQNRTRRRLQPKSMLDFTLYNREYGQGNLVNAMLIDMQSSANKIGMARTLGDSPLAAYMDIKNAQQEFDPKGRAWWHQADLYFQEIMGTNKTAVSPTLAAIDANLRAATAIARLPLVTLRSLPDINFMANFAMTHGVNYFEAWGTHIKNIFDLYPSEDRKYLAKAYGSMFRQQLGYLARYGETSNTSEKLNKISTAFFKINGLHAFDNANKMSGLELVSRGLGRNSTRSYKNLPLATKNWVDKFMEPHEWEALRGKTQRKMFTVDNVNALTEGEVKDLYKQSEQIRPLSEYRNDLYRRVHAMAQIATENMVLNPGSFERAFMLQGTKPGTPLGVLLRQISHFKTYTLGYIDKVLIQGYKRADANQQKLAWAVSTLVGAMPLTYGVMMMENLAMGKSMPDVSKMSPGQAEKFLLELSQSGLALFSGILDPRHQNSDMITSLLGSPSIRLLSNALATAASIITTNPLNKKNLQKDLKHLMDTLSYLTPIKTTPVLTPMLNQAMGEKGYVEPGQKHYFGR